MPSPKMVGKTFDFPDLKADCSACASLCCIALHFDKGDAFSLDKPAGIPCPHLSKSSFGCSIHDHLEKSGFKGCIQFDCLGAGQAVTQDVFAGRNWRDTPDALEDMITAFRIMRRLHAALEILKMLSVLPLNTQELDLLTQLLSDFTPPEQGWTLAALGHLEASAVFKRYQNALPSFRRAASNPNALAALRGAT